VDTNLPAPRLIDPSSVPSLRWGILGAGGIAEAFASTLLANTNQRIAAVASLTPGKAEAFAKEHSIPVHLSSYQDLVEREDVDAVYIANQPNDHYKTAMLALTAGRPVLVEKPITKNVKDAQAIFALAHQSGLLAMEAMWTRYLPQVDVARQLIESGAIGEPKLILSSFCEDVRWEARMWRKGHGSPLWDMGIYPISLCQMVFGEPTNIRAHGIILDDGMDAETTVRMTYASGARANFIVSGVVDVPHHATIAGEDGVIEFRPPFIFPSGVGIAGKGSHQPMQWWTDDSNIRRLDGLAYQVTAFADYQGRGLLESPLQSHDDSLACLRVAAEITRCIGADPY
jgi:predicted dehydrogenase